MLSKLDLRDIHTGYLGLLPRPKITHELPVEAVRAIIARVRAEGDAALLELTAKFDGATLTNIEVPRSEIDDAYRQLPKELMDALLLAADSIEGYHRLELEGAKGFEANGIKVTHRPIPMHRAGCYVPGGLARYPSTVLMTAIPAKVAGVSEVYLVTPPRSDGKVDSATLAAAKIAGVDRVFAVGGAQAVAGLAYGTETVPKVDVIVGPGNVFVSVAKREVAGEVAMPSSFAGPSEVVVVADRSVPSSWAAVDIVVQAEHGPDGLAWLITWDEEYAADVDQEVDRIVSESPRGVQIRSTLDEGGYVALVRDRQQALEIANEIAPEHLELLYSDAAEDLDLVVNAGAVFYGPYSPASFGDYVAGPSHVLPTFGSARFSSALRVHDFLKFVHFVTVTPTGLSEAGWAVQRIAETEGLYAHGQSVAMRMGSAADGSRGGG